MSVWSAANFPNRAFQPAGTISALGEASEADPRGEDTIKSTREAAVCHREGAVNTNFAPYWLPDRERHLHRDLDRLAARAGKSLTFTVVPVKITMLSEPLPVSLNGGPGGHRWVSLLVLLSESPALAQWEGVSVLLPLRQPPDWRPPTAFLLVPYP